MTRNARLAVSAARVACGLALSLAGCAKKSDAPVVTTPVAATSGAEAAPSSRCPYNRARNDVSEYDTSGDNRPDVRKVFVRIGEGSLTRLVLSCRETDINSDGVKDVVRFYTDEGDALREEADRNFDGKIDELTFFEKGQVVRQEFDSQADGKLDTKIYFDKGLPQRAERDLSGKSTPQKWQPDRWEYYVDGHMVRMGTDLDGDGKVDRWDRDANQRRAPDSTRTSTDDNPA
jgi:hypothetical protein